MAIRARRPRLTDQENFRADMEELKEKDIAESKRKLEEASSTEDLSPSHYKVHSTGKVEKMSGNMIDPQEWNLGDIPDAEVLDDGDEVQVTITSVRDAETKEDKIPYYRVMLEVSDRPMVKEFAYNVYKPHEGQTQKQSLDTRRSFQNFMKAFNMDMTRPFSPEDDWPGESAWCLVNMKEDKEYGKQNQVRKWILPK